MRNINSLITGCIFIIILVFSCEKFTLKECISYTEQKWYLGNFEAAYTGPRIGNLISFLKDLNILSSDNQLTEKGVSIFNQISLND